jgi:hypothetical protein
MLLLRDRPLSSIKANIKGTYPPQQYLPLPYLKGKMDCVKRTKTQQRTLPPIGFCIHQIIGSKYAH